MTNVILINVWMIENVRGNYPAEITNKIFSVHFLTVSVSFEENFSQKCNWVSGSPPMLYKLVLGPIPILHTNFQENPFTTLGISKHFKII